MPLCTSVSGENAISAAARSAMRSSRSAACANAKMSSTHPAVMAAGATRIVPNNRSDNASVAGNTGWNTSTCRSSRGPDIHGRKKSACGSAGSVSEPLSMVLAWNTYTASSLLADRRGKSQPAIRKLAAKLHNASARTMNRARRLGAGDEGTP